MNQLPPTNDLMQLSVPHVTVKHPAHLRKVSVSTLDNGLLVVSQDPIGLRDILSPKIKIPKFFEQIEPETSPDSPVKIMFTVKAGMLQDPEGKQGLAHMLEHLILTQNQAWQGERPLMFKLEEYCQDFNAHTSLEETVFEVTLPRKHVPRVFDLLANSIRTGLVDAERVLPESGVISAEMAMIEDDFLRNLLYQAQALAHGGKIERALIAGSQESVESITAKDIHSFHQRYYTPPNMAVSASGAISHAELLALCGHYFGNAKVGERTASTDAPFTPAEAAIERPTAQLGLALCLPSLDKRHPNNLANGLAVGLFLNHYLLSQLREQGISYLSAGLTGTVFNALHDDGLILVPTTPDKLERAVKVLCTLLTDSTKTMNKTLFDKIIYDIRSNIQSSVIELNFSDSHYVSQTLLLHGESSAPIRPQEVLELVNRLSLDDLRECIASLAEGEPTMLAYGPVAEAEKLAGKTIQDMFFTPVKQALAAQREARQANPPPSPQVNWIDNYNHIIKERATSTLKNTINNLSSRDHLTASSLLEQGKALEISDNILYKIGDDAATSALHNLRNRHHSFDAKEHSFNLSTKELSRQIAAYWLKGVSADLTEKPPLILVNGMDGSAAERLARRLPQDRLLDGGQHFWQVCEHGLHHAEQAPRILEDELTENASQHGIALISQDAIFDLITGRDAAKLPRALTKALKPVREWLDAQGFERELDKRIALSPLLEALEGQLLKAAADKSLPIIWHGQEAPEALLARAGIGPEQLTRYQPSIMAVHGEAHLMAEENAKRWEYSRGGLPAMAYWNSHEAAAGAWRGRLEGIAQGGEILPATPIWLVQMGFDHMEGRPSFQLMGKREGLDVTLAAGLTDKAAEKVRGWFGPAGQIEAARLSPDQQQAAIAAMDGSIGDISSEAAALKEITGPAAA
ncbi:hypothetical protein GC177_06255 [bacterium]|nr:hypothetical protein [bacterium]